MAENYTCPDCGKQYPAPPKWCPCTPVPVASPREATFLVELVPGRGVEQFDQGQAPSVEALSAGTDSPFRSAVMLREVFGSGVVSPEDCGQKDEPGTLAEWLEHLMRGRTVRCHPSGGKSSYILLQESHCPGVETLGETFWSIVDVTREEYDRLLGLAG